MRRWPGQFLHLPAFRQGPGQLGGLAHDARWQHLAVAMRFLGMHQFDGSLKRLAGSGGGHSGDQFCHDALLLGRIGFAQAKGLGMGSGGYEQRCGEGQKTALVHEVG